jgi:hypothetical protein
MVKHYFAMELICNYMAVPAWFFWSMTIWSNFDTGYCLDSGITKANFAFLMTMYIVWGRYAVLSVCCCISLGPCAWYKKNSETNDQEQLLELRRD